MPSVLQSFTFAETRDQICTAALTNVGAVGPGKAATGAQLEHAQRALNRLVKSLDPEGVHLWRETAQSFTTTAGVGSTVLASSVFSVDTPMRYVRAGQNTATNIFPISQDDYVQIPDRTVQGVPTSVFVDHTLASEAPISRVTLYFWPVPDATGDSIRYSAMMRSNDMLTGDNLPGLPQEWVRCLVYGLSMELAPAYQQIALLREYRSLFEREKEKLLASGGEQGGLTLVPFGGWGPW